MCLLAYHFHRTFSKRIMSVLDAAQFVYCFLDSIFSFPSTFPSGTAIPLPILPALTPTAGSDGGELKDLEIPNVSTVMSPITDMGTSYAISESDGGIPASLPSLPPLTTNSTLEAVFNEPISSVAVSDSGGPDHLLNS